MGRQCSIAAAIAALVGVPAPASVATEPVAESWVSEYPRVAAQAERDCAAARLDDCRRRLLQLLAMLDGRPDIGFRLAKVEARLGNREASLRGLESYARSRLDLGDPAVEPDFSNLRGDPRFADIERRYRAGLEPAGDHALVATLPARDLLAEDIGVDPRDDSRYLSSVREGRVLRLDASGKWSPFVGRRELSAWGLYALVVDPHRGQLWLGSAAGALSPPFRSEDHGRSAVLRVGLASHKVEHRYELHDGREHAFGDMALGAEGTVYVADGVGGGVYRIAAGEGAGLSPLVAPGLLRSPQTPAPAADGSRLFIPDYSRGIAIVNLRRGGSPTWLAHPPELALYGIDGLYLRGQLLVAVQNGTAPERLLLLHLDPGLARVVSWEVALARVAGLGDPTHGLITGRQFHFIANSGWDRFDEQGNVNAAAPATNPAIWSIELPE